MKCLNIAEILHEKPNRDDARVDLESSIGSQYAPSLILIEPDVSQGYDAVQKIEHVAAVLDHITFNERMDLLNGQPHKQFVDFLGADGTYFSITLKRTSEADQLTRAVSAVLGVLSSQVEGVTFGVGVASYSSQNKTAEEIFTAAEKDISPHLGNS